MYPWGGGGGGGGTCSPLTRRNCLDDEDSFSFASQDLRRSLQF